MRALKHILVTGGAGFIGTNFIKYLFSLDDFTGRIINLDLCTYAGNPISLEDVQKTHGDDRYTFIQGDITDPERVEEIFRDYNIDTVVHFAAESHVDRSIDGPEVLLKPMLWELLPCWKPPVIPGKSGMMFCFIM